MKNILLVLALIVAIVFTSCDRGSSYERLIPLRELDSIAYSRINDSISSLDTIRILNSLFLGMSPAEFDSLKESATNRVEIDGIVFDNIEVAESNGKIHRILFKSDQEMKYITDIEELAKLILEREKSFDTVVETLSKKYGKPKWSGRMSPIDKREHQAGYVSWNFDNLNVEYVQHHWASSKALSLTVRAEITYSIPRTFTKEEQQMVDSIIEDWKRQLVEKVEKNNRAKETL